MKKLTVVQKYRIYVLAFVFGLVLTFLGGFYGGAKSVVLWIGIGLWLSTYIWSFFIRCPSCGERMNKRFMGLHRFFLSLPKHCPECGEYLLDD
ncbi:MAG: hypothetical protein E7439_00145 [Ruminococcaceae bacterium]|nr:hypothetical protein [Oscillospiraceae bacterium]